MIILQVDDLKLSMSLYVVIFINIKQFNCLQEEIWILDFFYKE